MKRRTALFATTLLCFNCLSGWAAFWEDPAERSALFGTVLRAVVDEQRENPFTRTIPAILKRFEEMAGKNLVPGDSGKVVLKVDTNSGLGLSTPLDLTREVIRELMLRGFEPDNIFILDARQSSLRDAGYLPALSNMVTMGPYFDNVRVVALDSMEWKDPSWFYDSPLPREFTSRLGRELLSGFIQLDPEEARKSYLPAPLLTEVDFWINLPTITDHPAVGIDGTLSNASLWNISNNVRFFNSPANAPVAAAEICAIPELAERWALSIVVMRPYQFIAGPAFNANYIEFLPQIWASSDPVILDANALEHINRSRESHGFRPLPEIPDLLDFSMHLGLGHGLLGQTRWVDVDPRMPR